MKTVTCLLALSGFFNADLDKKSIALNPPFVAYRLFRHTHLKSYLDLHDYFPRPQNNL